MYKDIIFGAELFISCMQHIRKVLEMARWDAHTFGAQFVRSACRQ